LHPSDFWVLRKDLKILNSTLLNETVTLRAGTLKKEYFGY